jgi:hypothetical protein
MMSKLAHCMATHSPSFSLRPVTDHDSRRNSGELQCAVLALDAAPAAYALYRVNPSFDRGVQTGAVHVVEAMGVSRTVVP